jgi:hypothetical protein
VLRLGGLLAVEGDGAANDSRFASVFLAADFVDLVDEFHREADGSPIRGWHGTNVNLYLPVFLSSTYLTACNGQPGVIKSRP